jgi:cell division protein FtsZ
MIEIDLASQQHPSLEQLLPVTVVGIGGAGANILDTIALEGLPTAHLVALNTDARALQSSMLGTKLQLGQAMTRGLGAGGDPELGAEAARASEADIREELQDQKMVFLCVGLGGGTGSGASPLVARIAREEGAFVVVFAVMPFAFEGRRRLRQAEEALMALQECADALITFDNDRLGEIVLPKKGIHEAFAAADKIVSQSIRAIITLVTQPGLIRIGMDELIAAVGRGDSRCLFGFGSARGENRVSTALATALKSPLLHKGELRARGRHVLVHVCGGPQMTFAEVQDLMKELGEHLHEDAQILFGTGVDAAMGDELSLTVLTSLGPTAGERASAASVARGRRKEAPAPAPVTEPAAPPATPPEPAANTPARAPEGSLAETDVYESESEAEAVASAAHAEVEDLIEEEAPLEVAEYAAEAAVEGLTEEAPVASGPRVFHPRDLSAGKPAAEPARPPIPARPQFFQSWKRAEELREQSGPIEYEDVGSVSEFEPPEPVRPAPAPPSAAPGPRVVKPPGRLAVFFGRGRDEEELERGDPSTEQRTFDESLRTVARGRFDKAEPTIEDGEDLDIPTFMRRKR